MAANVIIANEALQIELIQTQARVANINVAIETIIPNVRIAGYCIQIEINNVGINGDQFFDTNIGPILKKGFRKVAELNSLDGLDIVGDLIDVTTLRDVDKYRKFILNVKDTGQLICSGFFYPGDLAGQISMFEDMNNRLIDNYTIEYFFGMSEGTWTFDALVSNYEVGSMVGEAVHFMSTLKVTGMAYLGNIESGGADSIIFVGPDQINELTAIQYIRLYSVDEKKYIIKFTTDDTFAVHVVAGNHYICYWIDDVFKGYLESDIPSELFNIFVDIPQKVSVKMWELDKTPKWYEFMLTRTV